MQDLTSLRPSVHLSHFDELVDSVASRTAWLWARQVEPFRPIYPAGLDNREAPTHPGSAAPHPTCPAATVGVATAWEWGGTRQWLWHCWLTCLVAPGNGCLSEVLDFLVLLQKALQKLGSFLNRNAKASSKPLLPCTSRNAGQKRPRLTPSRAHGRGPKGLTEGCGRLGESRSSRTAGVF